MPLTFNFDCILNRREKKLITFYFLKKYFFLVIRIKRIFLMKYMHRNSLMMKNNSITRQIKGK